MPLHELDGAPAVLLTQRRGDLRHHAGQICFPGGRVEPGEALLDAALREAQEEIGLAPGAGAPPRAALRDGGPPVGLPLDALGGVRAISLPVHGGARARWRPSWHVPLPALLAPGVHRTERRIAYGLTVEVHYYDVEGRTIWGATARVLHELLEIWRTL